MKHLMKNILLYSCFAPISLHVSSNALQMNFNDFDLNSDLSPKNIFIDFHPQGFFTAISLIYPVHAMASSYENVMYNLYQAIQHYKKNILKKK